MSIGFYDENQGRSYPLEYPAPEEVAPYIVDLSIYYGPDVLFDYMSEHAVLWSITRDGVDWLFLFRVRSASGALRGDITVRVGDGSEPFTTHHATTPDGYSYVYLTIGDIKDLQPWSASSINEVPYVEDRCVVAPEQQAVTSITCMNGVLQRSFLEDFQIVSPVNPAVNYWAAKGTYEYDPLAWKETVGEVEKPIVNFVPGHSATVRQKDGAIYIGMRRGEGDGYDCCTVLEKEQTVKGTIRSLWGLLPSAGGDMYLTASKGVDILPLPQEHTIKLIVYSPSGSENCIKPDDNPGENAPVIPDPPEHPE